MALELKAAFEHFGLQAFPKTSGSKGMQVYLPLNTPGVTYEDTRAFSRGLAQRARAAGARPGACRT